MRAARRFDKLAAMLTPRWIAVVVVAAACCPDRPAAQQPTYAPPPQGAQPAPAATAPYAAQPTTAPPTTGNVAATPAPPAAPPPAAPAPAPAPPPKEALVEKPAAPPPAGNPKGKPDGEACSSSKECKSGICEGQGCGYNAGKCAPTSRSCTRDLVTYCACNGETFGASGTCPGRLYRARGECDKKP